MVIVKVISTRNSITYVFKSNYRSMFKDSKTYYFPDSWVPHPDDLIDPELLVWKYSNTNDLTTRHFMLELLFLISSYQNQRANRELSNEQFNIKIRCLDAAVSKVKISINL